MHRTGIGADPRVKRHDAGPGFPEQPARFSAILNRLEWSGLASDVLRLEDRVATDDELALVHTREFIALVDREIAQNRGQLSTGDTPINAHSGEAARIAAGCVLSAVDAVYSYEVQNAFCIVRPPGHHASASRGMGFCLFNSVAIAARYAQQKHGAARVLIVDWDVHHGNGTQDIFYEDGSVLFFSTHQSPWYPGTGDITETGEGDGVGKTINCPFPAGTDGVRIQNAFRSRLLPAAEAFRPDLVLISAGFDSRIGDPLGLFRLTDNDFAELTGLMLRIAERHCSGRIVSVLEGGYNLEGLALAAEAHVRALLGEG
ncbi:MAG: histone deacetylase [Acidobacteriaceae bacterium]|nr:histone deacetylase [Acidobacteriaceae bacterium]MBV9502258.1 histone deacetylase [Acidobacteriaceae bacterium]